MDITINSINLNKIIKKQVHEELQKLDNHKNNNNANDIIKETAYSNYIRQNTKNIINEFLNNILISLNYNNFDEYKGSFEINNTNELELLEKYYNKYFEMKKDKKDLKSSDIFIINKFILKTDYLKWAAIQWKKLNKEQKKIYKNIDIKLNVDDKRMEVIKEVSNTKELLELKTKLEDKDKQIEELKQKIEDKNKEIEKLKQNREETTNSKPCYFFFYKGHCLKGARCNYLHNKIGDYKKCEMTDCIRMTESRLCNKCLHKEH